MSLKLIKSIEELNGMQIKGGGILPFAFHEGDFHFLFGRETKDVKWSDRGLWGTWGGEVKRDKETNLEGIIREFWEETNGLFGSKDSLNAYVNNNFQKLLVVYTPNFEGITIFLPTTYNKSLEKMFNASTHFCKTLLNGKKEIAKARQRGFLEKDAMQWFTINDIGKAQKRFRKMVHDLIEYMNQNFNPENTETF